MSSVPETFGTLTEENEMRRRSRTQPRAEVLAELLDGWGLAAALPFMSERAQQREIALYLNRVQGLPVADCGCALCEAIRGRVSGV